tara:strand:- start:4412 stop:5827 length:1416 start_codon:yes stop_codon:yes gene_type:complete
VIDEENIKPLESEAPLIIYIDFKSPYAYLSVAPTREMLSKLNVIADWRPFVLDIPSYLGSAKLDEGGKRVSKQNRTEEQWSGVKYAYFDCRRYANLSGMTVRGTIKIWNTDLPSIGMLWVKRFSDLVDQCQAGSLLERYIDSIYDPFWKRELDVEDPSAILNVLEGIGAPTEGFLDYIKGKGFSLNEKLQKLAFDAGVYGVPTYILPNESVNDPKHEKFFGREHLPRITWLLSERNGEAPTTAYNLPRQLDEQVLSKSATDQLEETRLRSGTPELITFFDFNSAHSYVALESIKAVKKEGISINWKPFSSKLLKAPDKESSKEDRGTKHRRIRGEYIANDIQRYAPHHLRDIYIERDCKFADMGLLWLQKKFKAGSDSVDSYVTRVFHHIWKDSGSIATSNDIEEIIIEQGLSIEGWKEYSEGLGLQHLEEVRNDIDSKAVNVTPVFYIGTEPFQGHSQLPLVITRLKLGI